MDQPAAYAAWHLVITKHPNLGRALLQGMDQRMRREFNCTPTTAAVGLMPQLVCACDMSTAQTSWDRALEHDKQARLVRSN